MDAFLATMVAQSRVPIERALALVRDRYGLETRAARLTGERDENFRLTAADGVEYVLKVANPAEDPAVTDLAIAALLHVEGFDPSLPCPRVVRDLSGACSFRCRDEGGVERTARIVTYLPGKLLGAAARSPPQRAACGRIAARLSRALAGFRHPAAQRALIWDLQYVGRVPQLLAQLTAFRFRAAAAELLGRIVPAIESHWPRLRRQIVHNDLNPLNILVQPTDEDRLAGVIDFGDLTHTALIADLAVAAAELLPVDCTGREACQSILDVAGAYHELVPLRGEELTLLGTLVAGRLVTIVVVHEWHLHHNPTGGHYAPFDPGFIGARLELAAQLLGEEIRL